MIQYIKFRLTPGQQAPKGSTSILLLKGDWIVWCGEESTFESVAVIGKILSTDTIPLTTIKNEVMTEDEISEYNDIVAGKYDDIEKEI